MALTDENNLVMPVQPMNYGNNGGFGFGGDWAWILLLLVLGGGWGGFGMGGFGGAMVGADMCGGFGLYPWLNNSQNINDGFREQQLATNIGGIQNAVTAGFGDVQNALCAGFGNVQNSLCGGFAGVNASINGAQNAIAQQMYGNEIASLERSFAAQTANTAGLTNLSSQLANCCCENRAATQDVKYTIANEACATRAANSANTQAILDKLCAIELDTVKSQLAQAQRENVGLQNQLNMATMQASQVAQTAEIRASQAVTANQLVSELRSCPIPSQPVYGNQPIFTCPQNAGCGCSCGGFAN
jgi:hypothetical protein